MISETKQDLHEWIADWQEESATSMRATPAEEIRRHVRKRERLLIAWLVGDVVIGLGFAIFLLHRVLTHPDPIEKLAMGLLLLAVFAVGLFEGYNWRGSLAASAETTATYLTLALDRSRRLRRSLRAGWLLLGAEILVFVPWTWYQLHGNGVTPTAERSVLAWGLLFTMSVIGALSLRLAQRWATRDAANLVCLRSELLGGEAEPS
jgi:hypothetical protein